MSRNRWSVVCGAVLIQLCLGAVYAWSLFNQPLIDKYGWSREGVVLTFSITIAVFSFFTIIAGKIQDKIGPRWVATAGGVLLGIGLLLASKATTLTQLYIFYGFIGGAGIGTAYVCPLATCVKWFPDKRGLISGIAVAGFGAGGLLFKPIIQYFLTNFGVSSTFLYLGIIYLIIIIIGAQFLVTPPKGYTPPGWKPTANALSSGIDFSTSQMVTTYQFYLIWVIYLFGCMAGLAVISLAADIGINLVNLNAATAANAVITIALFNAAGRIAWGRISDLIGRVASLISMYILTAIAMVAMSFIDLNYLTFMIFVSLTGFCFGGFLAIFPSLIADYYGTKNLGINYGIIFLAYGLAAIVGPLMAASLGYIQSFLISTVLCLASAGITLFLKPPVLSEKPVVKLASE